MFDASAPPADERRILTMEQLGDWSSDVVPYVEPGTRAWVDGPHGVFTIGREEGAALPA